jgi:hypothetical protein
MAPTQTLGRGGVWECDWRAALAALDQHGKLDWSMAFLDGSFAPAKKGGENVSLTRKGKGTKWMPVVDGNGLPLGFHLDGANRAEVQLAEQTLDTIRVARPRGRPKQQPEQLVADRGYDSSRFRRVLRGRGIRMCIPPKRHPKNWKAKRDAGGRPQRRLSTAIQNGAQLRLVGQLPALLIRWKRLFSVYRSGFAFAVILLCMRRTTAFACPIP